MFLAGYTFFDKSVAIDLHCRLEVSGTEDSGSHGSCARVIAAYVGKSNTSLNAETRF